MLNLRKLIGNIQVVTNAPTLECFCDGYGIVRQGPYKLPIKLDIQALKPYDMYIYKPNYYREWQKLNETDKCITQSVYGESVEIVLLHKDYTQQVTVELVEKDTHLIDELYSRRKHTLLISLKVYDSCLYLNAFNATSCKGGLGAYFKDYYASRYATELATKSYSLVDQELKKNCGVTMEVLKHDTVEINDRLTVAQQAANTLTEQKYKHNINRRMLNDKIELDSIENEANNIKTQKTQDLQHRADSLKLALEIQRAENDKQILLKKVMLQIIKELNNIPSLTSQDKAQALQAIVGQKITSESGGLFLPIDDSKSD